VSKWWTGIPAAETTVACSGHTHTLRWEHGELTALNHGDLQAEAALAALAGEPARCLELLSAWNRRRNDPRVLALASRGVLDPVQVTINQRPHPHAPVRRRAETELLELLALNGGLPDRLQAHVAATWTRRLRTGHASRASTMPQLQAALYGRTLGTLRLWLGEPNLAIDLTMVDPGADPQLKRTSEGVAIALPFSWLLDVWARGLATMFGRLCVKAETADGIDWTLDTIGTDMRTTEQVLVSLPRRESHSSDGANIAQRLSASP
jgi:hypothetical protein